MAHRKSSVSRIFEIDAEAIKSEIPVINMVNIGKGTISNQNKKGLIR